jgi:hypothetical protein
MVSALPVLSAVQVTQHGQHLNPESFIVLVAVFALFFVFFFSRKKK